jgi:hypothetical protein
MPAIGAIRQVPKRSTTGRSSWTSFRRYRSTHIGIDQLFDLCPSHQRCENKGDNTCPDPISPKLEE